MTFDDGRNFIISRIVQQAQAEGVTLSELERQMLLFTEEPGYSGPDLADLNERFNQQYDDNEYEEKIAGLIHRAYDADRRRGNSQWSEAFQSMQGHDIYLMVMLEEADVGYTGEISAKLKALPVVAIVVIVAIVAIVWVLARSH